MPTADLRYLPRMLHLPLRLQDAYPRFTPLNYFEMDVMATNQSGLLVELEHKSTLSDFRADARKDSVPYALKLQLQAGLFTGGPPATTKWEILAGYPSVGPAYFWFVAPHGVLKEQEIPEWAGFIEYQVSDTGRPLNPWVRREAPRRNKNHLSPEEEHRARRNVCRRYAFGTNLEASADQLTDLAAEPTPVLSSAPEEPPTVELEESPQVLEQALEPELAPPELVPLTLRERRELWQVSEADRCLE